MALVDLDAELIRIRDIRSRVYFGDALKCYRAGAFRAAISSTWVALVYDLIRKYRELDGLGDAEACAFLEKWDASVAATNVGKLLDLEKSLLDHAHQKMAIIDTMGLRTLKRLYEDRHLSAHPAFANRDDLYEPSDELVRAHMAAAVELVFAQRPVQGKGLFEAFSTDIQSPGFPSAPKVIVDYVERKYLANMRTSVLRNFGVVVAKSLIQNVPLESDDGPSPLGSATLAPGGPATLEFAGRRLAVHAIPVSDPAAVARASQEYLRKYQPSPYAQAMVSSDILPTTLRLEPR